MTRLRRRTLTWVRGLKQHGFQCAFKWYASHPYMGAWIETLYSEGLSGYNDGRTLTWVRGLKQKS